MGLSFSRSINLGGGIRLNLSGAGIGVSAGIPGLRFGAGPRGFHVSAGAGGFRYRATVPMRAKRVPEGRSAAPGASPSSMDPATSVDMVAIANTNVETLADSSSSELVEEIKRKKGTLPLQWLGPLPGIALALLTLREGWPQWLMLVWLGLAGGGWLWLNTVDRWRRCTALFYDADGPHADAFEALSEAGGKLAACKKTWRIVAQGAVAYSKYHAGANALVDRKDAAIFMRASHPYFVTNVPVPVVRSLALELIFLPDMLLVSEGGKLGGLSYASIQTAVSESQFRETDPVPADASVIGKTWTYVNKSGGPDKRFKDNREIPICRYSSLTLRSSGGLHTYLMFSKSGVADDLAEAIQREAHLSLSQPTNV